METKRPRLECLPGKRLASEEAKIDDLSLDDLMSAITGRVRNGQYADQLEANLLLAIIEGRTDDTDCWMSWIAETGSALRLWYPMTWNVSEGSLVLAL